VKPALAKAGLVLVGLAFMLLVGEVAARVYYKLIWDVPFFRADTIRRSSEFGWAGRAVHSNVGHRPRVLVVGDSMTNGLGVADADLYSAVVAKLLDAEVFTYGGAGYGTLQEYMVVDRYLDEVRPDLVVLQVSYNDQINNSFELERASWLNNNLAIRPYLEGDRIEYRFPSRLGLLAMRSRLRLACWLAMDAHRVAAMLARKGYLHSVEEHATENGPPFLRANQTTEAIVVKLKARVGSIPLVAFSADAGADAYWRLLLARQGVPLYEGVPAEIERAERQLGSVRPDGVHWNTQGHHVVGATLARWLADQIRRR
jgi:lysophospholipase L1-like esterase